MKWPWLGEARKPGIPESPIRADELSPRQIQAILANVGDDDPLWRVVHQLIGLQIEAAVAEALDVNNQEKPQLLSYYNGAAAHLRTYRDFLKDEREKAQRTIELED